jgi:hypothetical protein
MTTQIAIVLTIAIIATTVIVVYALYKWWEWKNPYIDEIDKEGESGHVNSKNMVTGKWARIERTYKNGTITYIHKNWSL